MKVYINQIAGIDDAIVSMYMSKRSWTREMEEHIREVCARVQNPNGSVKPESEVAAEDYAEFNDWLNKVTKWGRKHVTMLRFVDFSITVEGLHRAGQDDWDSHAQRFNNRIIRSSTRLASFSYEMSDWYKDKILPTDAALSELGINLPETITHNGEEYVKGVNGYIKKGMEDNQDVKRGLYMLSIPSNFIFKVNLTEWAHVFKERNATGGANPEVKECCEAIADGLERMIPQLNRQLFNEINN